MAVTKHRHGSGLVPVGSPLPPAEAGFLRDALRQEGIRAVLREEAADKTNRDQGAWYVDVPLRDLEAALLQRESLLPEADEETAAEVLVPRRKMSILDQAIGAAVLGLIVAIRIGHGAPGSTLVYCLLLSGAGIGLVLIGNRKSHDEEEDEHEEEEHKR